MSVIRLDERREREPHLSGAARCGGCGYEWVAVAPIGVILGLECPECGLTAGYLLETIWPEEGTPALACRCGDILFFALEGGLMCQSCGIVHPYEVLK